MGGATEPVDTTPTTASDYGGGVASQSALSLGEEEGQHMLLIISEEMGVSPDVMGGEGVIGTLCSPGQDEGEVSMEDLGEHVGVTGEKYICSTCNKTFDRPYRLQRHIQVHNPNRPKVRGEGAQPQAQGREGRGITQALL